MRIQDRVLKIWIALSPRERRLVRNRAKVARDVVLRSHCRIILSLVGGNGARALAQAGLCSTSQVYRVAQRFVEQGPFGPVDQRQYNGETKADEYCHAVLFDVVANSSPRKYGYPRATWTEELLVLALEKETGVRVSTTTMSRVLKRLRIRCGRPKPIVYCPWKNGVEPGEFGKSSASSRAFPRTKSSCTRTKSIFT